MCLAIPLTIEEIQDKTAVASANGISQKIRIDFLPDIQIGDEVLVHSGFAIEKIDKEEAMKTKEVYKELFDVIK